MDLRRHRRWLIAAGLAVLAIGAVVYRMYRPLPVTVEPVVRGRAVEAVYATGSVEPIHRAVVKARVSEHVEAISVDEGDRVTAGQLLAKVHDPVRGYALSESETQLARARRQAGPRSPQLAGLEAQARALRSQLALARLALARSETLRAREAIAQEELDTARYRVSELQAQADAADEQLRSARLELAATRDQLTSQAKSLATEVDETTVISPLTGLVLRREVEPGEVVEQNQTMFEVADVSTLLIELNVDEADIARVKDGPDASAVALSFYAFPGQAFAGKVVEILPQPDRVRRSYTVKVALDAPISGLRVGMTAEANIIVQHKNGVLLLPAEAVDGDAAWFAEDGRAVRRAVTLGVRDLTRAEVVAGADDGALAIVDPPGTKLAQGQRVSARDRTAK